MTGAPQPNLFRCATCKNKGKLAIKCPIWVAKHAGDRTTNYNYWIDRMHEVSPIVGFCCHSEATTSAKVLEELFAPMDKFYGKMTKTQIIKWSVKQQNSFITNATATYLLARELRQQEKKGA